jgi:hypothetical protein
MAKYVPFMRQIESYSLGSLADGSVILHFRLPGDPVPWALRFDDATLDDFLEKVADTRREALKRKAPANRGQYN